MLRSLSLIRTTAICAIPLTFFFTPPAPAQDSSSPTAVHIVVLQGDNAVNVLKKGTVVMPVVQVLDQTGKPVAGAAVTFFAPGDGASVQFSDGSRIATITTGDDGKASPIGGGAVNTGAFEYQVTAVFHDQRVTATIKQTNVTSEKDMAGSGANNLARSSHTLWWVAGGVAAAAAVAIAVGLGHGGSGTASTIPTATIGAGSGATTGAPH